MTEPFQFKDGRAVHTVKELLGALQESKELYTQHVSETNNDFCNWLEHLGQPTLARSLRDAHSYEETLTALKNYEQGQSIVYRERPLAAFFLGVGVGVLFCLVVWALLGAIA